MESISHNDSSRVEQAKGFSKEGVKVVPPFILNLKRNTFIEIQIIKSLQFV